MYILTIFAVLLFVLFIYMFNNKIKIKWRTFKEKGFSPTINKYGVYCYCAKQGGGKTLSCVGFLYDNRDKVIYANLKSIDKNVIPYTYISGIEDLLALRSEHDIIIFFDEIFTEISKLLKSDNQKAKAIMDFLSQMRKRRIILLTTCQEWRLLPLYFRLYVRYQVNCKTLKLPFIKGITIKNFIDGDNIKWDETEQDFVGDLIENVVEHTRLKIANMYDTYEQIGEYSNYTTQPVVSSLEPHERGELLQLKKEEVSKVHEDIINGIDNDFWEHDVSPKDVEVTPLFVNEEKL